MRFLALDVGDRKIGIAVSDELGWIAQGLETYYRRGLEKDCDYLESVARKYSPHQIVVGLPKNMNGTIGPQAEKVMEFANVFAERSIPEIVFWDERLTTVAAERTLIAADMNRKKRKLNIDKVAATYILQNYLDSINNK